jgi:Helix-turn-helix family
MDRRSYGAPMDTPTGAPALRHPARRLGAALEPVIGQVYFATECHAAYVALGFGPSPRDLNGVAAPDGDAYFTSRGSLLGQAPGEVVAAAFGVFSIDIVVPAVTRGWERTDAPTIRAARDRGALAQLERLLGAEPEGLATTERTLLRAIDGLEVSGRALAAGAIARASLDHPLGELFRAGDVLREYRGDSHIASWVAAGLSAIDIGLLTERYWGLPLRSYSRTRGWTDAQYDEAEESLAARGLLVDGDFTDAGRELRERIEVDTDLQMAPVLGRIGDDLEGLLDVLSRWGATVREGKGYPQSGPHDLARDQPR